MERIKKKEKWKKERKCNIREYSVVIVIHCIESQLDKFREFFPKKIYNLFPTKRGNSFVYIYNSICKIININKMLYI